MSHYTCSCCTQRYDNCVCTPSNLKVKNPLPLISEDRAVVIKEGFHKGLKAMLEELKIGDRFEKSVFV